MGEARGGWRQVYRRLRASPTTLVALALFGAIVAFVLAAPLWADHVAETGPNATHITEKVEVGSEARDVVSPDGTPVGPLWLGADGRFFLGADGSLGRDEMVRLMYGGRTSLTIGLAGVGIATVLGLVLALLAGYFRGWTDTAISRTLEVIWAFPVLLLGIAIGTALAVGGLKLGPIEISSNSIWIPILIVSLVFTPYIARPIRGQVLALREREFVDAAIAQGASPIRVMMGELLPNLWSILIVFFTLNVATAMLVESALSFVGAGVKPPHSSWGTMLAGGFELLYSAPRLTIIPGVMILLAVLSLNLIGDGLRQALDPRSKLTLEAHTGTYEESELAR